MEKGSHYNLCISDLIMGLLFIFILVLLKFMLDLQNEKEKLELQSKTENFQSESQSNTEKPQDKTQSKTEEPQNKFEGKMKKLSGPSIKRGQVMRIINKELEKEGIKSEIDEKNGTLKLVSNVHYFDSGKYELNKKGKEDFKKIRKVLFENVVCYSAWKNKVTQERWPSTSENQEILTRLKERCQTSKDKYGLIDSILIEGHADRTPIPAWGSLWIKGIRTNLDLAVKRSISVFQILLEYKETNSNKKISSGNYLFALTNKKGNPLFGVTSFGNLRSHRKEKNRNPAQIKKDKVQDRRIDIRFVMSQPEELKKIKDLNKENQNNFEKDGLNE